jgi:RAQPRD family integrative conjugative element protein
MRFFSLKLTQCSAALLLAALWLWTSNASATDPDLHRQNLASALHQLDLLDRFLASITSTYQPSPAERYHFDHTRLREDLQRVRAGIQVYLSPPRAQPREPEPLGGDYVLSARAADAQAAP